MSVGEILRPAAAGRLQRITLFLGLAAWAMVSVICPVPDMAPNVQPVPEHHHANGPAHDDSDPCCQLRARAPFIIEARVGTAAIKAPLPAFSMAILEPLIPALADPLVGTLIPRSHGPPRDLYLRFATFWAHAPPY